jgi:hypothetical protein
VQQNLEQHLSQLPADMAQLLRAHRGRLLQKWLHYFEIYDRHLARFRGKPVQFLEIGVWQGGSLEFWRAYLGPEATIHGVDIDPKALETANEAGARIHVGDQADPDFLARLKAEIPRMDVVVDDGGHQMHQLTGSFQVLYPHLAADGVYICEDLHACYMESYGGGYRNPASFLERSKDWIDQLHAWYCDDADLRATDFARTAWSIHYYDSVLVVEKRPWRQPMAVEASAGGLKVFPARPR